MRVIINRQIAKFSKFSNNNKKRSVEHQSLLKAVRSTEASIGSRTSEATNATIGRSSKAPKATISADTSKASVTSKSRSRAVEGLSVGRSKCSDGTVRREGRANGIGDPVGGWTVDGAIGRIGDGRRANDR